MASKKILVIEDNELNLKLIDSLLKLGHYDTVRAVDAETGIQLAREHDPDLVLMDIQLPGMDGFELHQRIVDSGSAPPVIFITAHPDAETRTKAAKADAVAYLEKPFDDRRLLAALDAALDRIKGGPASSAGTRPAD